MNPDSDGSDLGYLGRNGVLIVPAPAGDGEWLVTLAHWDGTREEYVATSDGPLFEDRDEAMQEAARIASWLSDHQDEDEVARVWNLMRQEMARENMPDRGHSLRLGSFFPGL